MGKTRDSANLVSDYNIKVDIDNGRVGVGTSSPSYDLDVVGDVNFSGTLYQGGSEFTLGVGIQSAGTAIGSGITQLNFVGTGNTFAVNGSTVDISISGSGGAGLSTTGFSTSYGIHIDPVGAGVTYSEDLVVVGNARVTGILSIGTSSIVLNASDNSIKLSSDAVIRRDESTGDIRFLDNSGNLKKIIANEIRVGSGNTTILIGRDDTTGNIKFTDTGGNLKKIIADEIQVGSGNSISVLKSRNGKLVVEDSEGTTSGSEHATLRVTGVTTVGGVKIQSGIVTAASGIVTYYGDGSNLQGVVSGIELKSAGSSVGTGITAINFASGATLTTASAGIATVTISGGGGGGSSLTTYDDEIISNDSGWSASTTYQCCMRAAGGKKGNSFFFARLEYSSTYNATRLRVYPFTVNRSTGAITWGSASNVWYNSSYGSISTTFWHGVDGTGSVFAGGNNPIPGYTSHVFSYSRFVVNENGTISGGTYSYTNADHGYNGMFYALPTAENSGYMITAGYNANASSRAYYRTHSVSGTSISTGSLTNLNSDTSTSYGVGMIAQPGVYQSGNQVCQMIYYRTSSSNYYVQTVAANGNTASVSVPNWDSNAFAFQMTNGDVILYSDAHTPMRFTAYNSASTMSSASAFPGSNMYYSFAHFGLGNNEFVLGLHSSSVINFGYPLLKATLDATTGFTITATADIPALVSVGMESSYTGMYPLYASESDTTPDKMLFVRHESNSIRAKVTDFPTFS